MPVHEAILAKRYEVDRIARLFRQHPLRLEHFHAVGGQLSLLVKRTPYLATTKGWRARVATLVGKSVETLNKCFQLYQTYDSGKMASLEKMGVGWGLLLIAIGIPGAADRQRLLRQATKEGWTCHDLQRAIQRMKGTCRGGGRKRRQPKSHGLLPDVHELSRLTTLWNEFETDVMEVHRHDYQQELTQVAAEHQATLAEVLEAAVAKITSQKKKCQETIVALQGFQETLRDMQGRHRGATPKTRTDSK